MQELDAVEEPPFKHGTVHSGVGYSSPRVVPDDTDLQRAADILNAGQRVAMLVGAGALHATDEVIEVAEMLGAGIAKALLGKAAIADDYPFVTGPIGLLGSKPSYEMMTRCDTLLMVGSNFPYSEFLPKPGQAHGVQIEHRRAAARHSLSDGRESRRRQPRDPSRAAADAEAEDRSQLAKKSSGESPTGGRRSRGAR